MLCKTFYFHDSPLRISAIHLHIFVLLFLCKVELSCTLVTTEIASNITGVIVALFVMLCFDGFSFSWSKGIRFHKHLLMFVSKNEIKL